MFHAGNPRLHLRCGKSPRLFSCDDYIMVPFKIKEAARPGVMGLCRLKKEKTYEDSAFFVAGPQIPSGLSPCSDWNTIKAPIVFGPATPSRISEKPCSLSRC